MWTQTHFNVPLEGLKNQFSKFSAEILQRLTPTPLCNGTLRNVPGQYLCFWYLLKIKHRSKKWMKHHCPRLQFRHMDFKNLRDAIFFNRKLASTKIFKWYYIILLVVTDLE